jgi:hypothetical protein
MSSFSDFTDKFIFIKEMRQAPYPIFLFLALHLYLLCLTEAFVGTHSEWIQMSKNQNLAEWIRL